MSALHPHVPRDQPERLNAHPLDVTIRFSASLPDLPLTVPARESATTNTLKQLIRAALPSELHDRRIRLIYSGKALVDDASLASILKRTISHPPSRAVTPSPYDDNDPAKGRSKGKEPVRDPPVQSRIYIHCSIGDVVLSAEELAAEAAVASRGKSSGRDNAAEPQHLEDAATTTPAPRGFDRLLAAGFTAAEVQSLRMQFIAIQAHTHTPDSMPSPNSLRHMEDQWLDNSSEPNGAAGLVAGGVIDDDGQAGALDDMLWGATMGFFWPVGCLFWGMREDGIWSQRRKMAVVVGVALNIGLGFIRYTDQ